MLILSASLRPQSKSRALAQEAARILATDGAPPDFVDLREMPLPLCDGNAAYSHPDVGRARELVRQAEGILVATPIYNFDASATLKNFIELTGKSWENQVVGFLCSAGGSNAYMSIMALANSLMLDFRCVIVPRFVYATGRDFAPNDSLAPEILDRVAQCARATAALSAAVRASSALSTAPRPT